MKHFTAKSPRESVGSNEAYARVDGSRAPSSVEELAPLDAIISTQPLKEILSGVPSMWSQTQELKLLKLPGEESWGLSITGPDVWREDGESVAPHCNIAASLPAEVSKPVFVSNVAANTAAARCGLLEAGDIIIGVNGMDATRVGCRAVAQWIQAANLVSSSSASPPFSGSSGEEEESTEWAFLYLLVLSLNSPPATLAAAGRPSINLQSIPPVALAPDSTAPLGVGVFSLLLSFFFIKKRLFLGPRQSRPTSEFHF